MIFFYYKLEELPVGVRVRDRRWNQYISCPVAAAAAVGLLYYVAAVQAAAAIVGERPIHRWMGCSWHRWNRSGRTMHHHRLPAAGWRGCSSCRRSGHSRCALQTSGKYGKNGIKLITKHILLARKKQNLPKHHHVPCGWQHNCRGTRPTSSASLYP